MTTAEETLQSTIDSFDKGSKAFYLDHHVGDKNGCPRHFWTISQDEFETHYFEVLTEAIDKFNSLR